MADSNKEPSELGRDLGTVGIALLLSPLLAVIQRFRWAIWRHPLVGLSVLINVVFAVIIVVVILDGRLLGELAEGRRETLIGPDCVAYEPEHLRFCRPRSGSELARIEPNTVYAAAGGLPRARFIFESLEMRTVVEISAFDKHGRQWMHVDSTDGSTSYDHYADDLTFEPDVSFLDKDADGIPDKKVDWGRKRVFERVGNVVWRELKKKED